MRGASLRRGSTPCSFADRDQEADTSSIPAAGASPCATEQTCSACRIGVSIELAGGTELPILPTLTA